MEGFAFFLLLTRVKLNCNVFVTKNCIFGPVIIMVTRSQGAIFIYMYSTTIFTHYQLIH